ncbi:hypothetical protein WG66_004967 [Moniliophthora roreri]|nr:hypothetical protein WG66_004967 [Moniliophthora roreri]
MSLSTGTSFRTATALYPSSATSFLTKSGLQEVLALYRKALCVVSASGSLIPNQHTKDHLGRTVESSAPKTRQYVDGLLYTERLIFCVSKDGLPGYVDGLIYLKLT